MQEHAEEPRSAPMKPCTHCGATLAPQEAVCPKCGTARPEHPGMTRKEEP